MQGQRNSMGALPENFFFGDGSISGDSVVGTQMTWNNDNNNNVNNSSGTYEQNRPRHTLPSNHNSMHFLQHSGLYDPNVEWVSGESSSSASQHQVNIGVRKLEDSWNFSSSGVLSFENRQYEPSGSTLPLDNNNAELNSNRNPTITLMGLPFPPDRNTELNSNRSPTITLMGLPFPPDRNAELNSFSNPAVTLMGLPFPRARNMSLGFENKGDCLEVQRAKPSYVSSDGQRQPSCSSLENQDKLRKRKALDFINMGQSSDGVVGTSQWQAQFASGNTNTSLQSENDDIVIGNASDPATSRQGLAVRDPESSRRNLRLRVNGLAHQVPQQSAYSDVRNIDNLSSNHSSRSDQNCFLGLNPTPEVETTNHLHMQPVSSRLPHRHSNWCLPSIGRLGSSSTSSYHPMSEERGPPVLEASSSRNIPEYPMLLSSIEIGNTSQNNAYLNSANRNLASSSRARPSTGLNPSETNQMNRTHVHRPRRLSEVTRRPLLASSGIEPGGQNGPRLSSSGLDGLSHRARSSVLLERHTNATFGFPRSFRTLGAATADEGRSSSMPEHVRRILDIMRRGEGLRFEDMMILDHPAFIAMADMHDRHRDMRMDVDNMSYEELLALEERIGDVCTGLSEETIMKHMKQQKYTNDHDRDQDEPEPCSICREEYNEGEDMGKLDCGHDFHRDCIKQWLKNKNLCPICKTPGLST